jgi:hypothetical protein
MSFFDDEVYENLDWLSQATMPLVFSGNKILSDLPDKIEVNMRNVDLNSFLYVSEILHGFNIGHGSIATSIMECYVFKSEGEEIDPIKDIYPTVWLEKIKKDFSEKDIINYVRSHIIQHHTDKKADIGRINEILDLIDYKHTEHTVNLRTSRSARKKMSGVFRRLHEIFSKNEWQVRDADLMISFVGWINQYILDGNLAALTNITKLKIMTHKNQPIYSIKEAV